MSEPILKPGTVIKTKDSLGTLSGLQVVGRTIKQRKSGALAILGTSVIGHPDVFYAYHGSNDMAVYAQGEFEEAEAKVSWSTTDATLGVEKHDSRSAAERYRADHPMAIITGPNFESADPTV